LFLLIGVRDFIFYFFKKEKSRKQNFLLALLHLLFAFGLSVYPKIPYSFLPWLIGFYFFFHGILQLVDWIILMKNQDKGQVLKILYVCFYFTASIFLIFYPLKNIGLFLELVGIYIVALGLHFITSSTVIMIPEKYKNQVKRKIRISLPVIVECVIPYAVLNAINDSLRVEDKGFSYEEKKNNEEADLEVIVHVSPNGFNRMGHVDIQFDGEVISYGNYDSSSTKCHDLFGDGVIFITKKEKYIPFCIAHSKKTLFVFGLKLTKQQKARIRKEIETIKKGLVRWYPPLELACKNHEKNMKEYSDYSSCLFQSTKAKFYKFTKGNFKTYFVLGNNCCLLADRIIGKGGIDLLKMNGLITPGTYYEYLNREFSRKGSFVISRNIYNDKRRRSKNEGKYFESK